MSIIYFKRVPAADMPDLIRYMFHLDAVYDLVFTERREERDGVLLLCPGGHVWEGCRVNGMSYANARVEEAIVSLGIGSVPLATILATHPGMRGVVYVRADQCNTEAFPYVRQAIASACVWMEIPSRELTPFDHWRREQVNKEKQSVYER